MQWAAPGSIMIKNPFRKGTYPHRGPCGDGIRARRFPAPLVAPHNPAQRGVSAMAPFQPSDPAALRIREAAARDTLSHAVLFTGAGDLAGAAQYAAAALECEGTGARPCGVCPACRKVSAGIHPDVATVRDEAHRNIAVDVVRNLRADAYIRPNEGRRKVYIFPDCGVLTEQDQNVLLKIVEEGPPYAAFLFCAENAAAVLQTLRSRCVELRLHPPAEGGGADRGAVPEAAEALCRAVGSGKRGAAAELAVRLEKKRITREDLAAMLDGCREVFAAALLLLYGQPPEEILRDTSSFLAKNLTKSQIMRTMEVLQTYRRECAYNVGPAHVLGALAVELEDIF